MIAYVGYNISLKSIYCLLFSLAPFGFVLFFVCPFIPSFFHNESMVSHKKVLIVITLTNFCLTYLPCLVTLLWMPGPFLHYFIFYVFLLFNML